MLEKYELLFSDHHENKVWTVVPVIPRICMLGDRMVGLWHGAGYGLYGSVLSRTYSNIDEKSWEEKCRKARGMFNHWHVKRFLDKILVQFQFDEDGILSLEQMCPSASWSRNLHGFLIDCRELVYLQFLLGTLL